jgi:hypothetical protein
MGPLGFPTSDEGDTARHDGRFNWFQGGQISWSPATGAHEVHGAIYAAYARAGYEMGPLGFPISDEFDTYRHDGRLNIFQNGRIYWSPATGAHEVHGAIMDAWGRAGWEMGPLGFPTSDEADTYRHDGRFNWFQGGQISWSPATGAHEVHGAIYAEYARMGYEMGPLGFPTSDEFDTYRHDGRLNYFQGGTIYWSPATGAHEIHGVILAQYASMGYEMSFLGFPTSDVQTTPTGLVSYFQNGKIVWNSGSDAYAVPHVSSMDFDSGYIAFPDPIPVGGFSHLTVYASGWYHFTGHFHESSSIYSSYDSLVWGLRSTSGYLYTFSHSGHLSGVDNDDWNVSGFDPRLAANWADLEGCQGYLQKSSSWDWMSLIQAIMDVAPYVQDVILIVGAGGGGGGGGSSNPSNLPRPEEGMPLGRLIGVDRVFAAAQKEVDRAALPRSKSESRFDDPLVDDLAVALLS